MPFVDGDPGPEGGGWTGGPFDAGIIQLVEGNSSFVIFPASLDHAAQLGLWFKTTDLQPTV
jgi:hypothetical protein